jgi:hypothetical protein
MNRHIGPGSVARAWAGLIAATIVIVWLVPYPVIAAAAPILRALGIVILVLAIVAGIGVALVIAFDRDLRDTATLTKDDRP